MPFTHRQAVRGDLARIVEIYNATIPSRRVTADTAPVSVESRVKWFEDHDPGFRPLWVVELEGRIAAVDESFRGLGLGSYLLAQAIGRAPSLGVDTLLGFIFGHNHPSLKLFEKFGFARWGELPRVALLDGVERDLVIVGRRA
jgi:phosphinothricin acetyltransferase